MSNVQQSIRELAARIRTPDDACARSVLKRLPEDLGQLRALAAAIARAQGLVNPTAAIKGLALFASDAPGSTEISDRVRQLLSEDSHLHTLAKHFDVKLAAVDVGLNEEFAQTEITSQILRQRLRVGTPTVPSVWEALQAGIRIACLMKGKDTDIFGLGVLRESTTALSKLEEIGPTSEWSLGAAAGFLLAAADLQTPVVLSGPDGALAVKLACELAPSVKEYVIPAQSGHSPDPSLTPLFGATMPHELAILITLSICDGAARLTRGN